MNVSETYQAMSLTHCADGVDDVAHDARLYGDAMNVPLSSPMHSIHSDWSVLIGMTRACHLHLKKRHYARPSTRILIIKAAQLYWIQLILMIIFVSIVLSFCKCFVRFLFCFVENWLLKKRRRFIWCGVRISTQTFLLRLAVELCLRFNSSSESISCVTCTTKKFSFFCFVVVIFLKAMHYAQTYRWNGTLAVIRSDVSWVLSFCDEQKQFRMFDFDSCFFSFNGSTRFVSTSVQFVLEIRSAFASGFTKKTLKQTKRLMKKW